MGKWLLAGATALVLLLLLLWLQLGEDAAPVAVTPHPVAHADQAPSAPGKTVEVQQAKADPVKEYQAELLAAEAKPGPRKLDVNSDEFHERFEEQVPRRLTREAAKCYEGRHGSLHRNQKLTLTFVTTIKKGVVTVHDVKVKEDTIQDAALNTCFMQQLARTSWKDDELPDYEVDDLLVMRPERGMRKYWSELQNDDGPEGPKW